MRFLAIILFVPVVSLAQTVRVGVRGGLPVSNLLTANQQYDASTQLYVIGPTVEISLSYGFAAGADFMLQEATVGIGAVPSRATVRRWELPVLITYHAPRLPVRPFVRAGLSFNRVFDIGDSTPYRLTSDITGRASRGNMRRWVELWARKSSVQR